MRYPSLSRVFLPLVLVLALEHPGAAQTSVLSETKGQQHPFLRFLEGSSADSGDGDANGDGDKCDAGCNTNNDVRKTMPSIHGVCGVSRRDENPRANL